MSPYSDAMSKYSTSEPPVVSGVGNWAPSGGDPGVDFRNTAFSNGYRTDTLWIDEE